MGKKLLTPPPVALSADSFQTISLVIVFPEAVSLVPHSPARMGWMPENLHVPYRPFRRPLIRYLLPRNRPSRRAHRLSGMPRQTTSLLAQSSYPRRCPN